MENQIEELSKRRIRTIQDYVRRLPRGNPVRDIAEDLLANRPPTVDIDPLIHSIVNSSARKWRERTVATWALGQLPLTPEQQHEATDILAKLLKDTAPSDTLKTSRLPNCLLRSLWLTVPITVIWEFILYDWGTDIDLSNFFVMLCVVGIPALAVTSPFSFAIDNERATMARIIAAETLGKLTGPISLNALADSAGEQGERVRVASTLALLQCLPTLQESDYGTLKSDTVPNLCHLLKTPDDGVKLEILEALRKIGDGHAVRPVEFLAKRWASPAVKAAAERVLPILQERRRLEQAPQILLRASSGEVAPDTLLRAVTSPAESTPPQQLLRAAQQTTPPD